MRSKEHLNIYFDCVKIEHQYRLSKFLKSEKTAFFWRFFGVFSKFCPPYRVFTDIVRIVSHPYIIFPWKCSFCCFCYVLGVANVIVRNLKTWRYCLLFLVFSYDVYLKSYSTLKSCSARGAFFLIYINLKVGKMSIEKWWYLK